ncbi:transcription factor [Fusarium langsethiae]|uniref:Transcription factor n=1 Tax=Fusarium langsethiae TaxID=179993 RepID=A0A0N0V850_FUSLA|nr:transcription factor [Fusarium langsethiae]GKU08061.1 unnamed protein product [Fusarium langsethiae]GKU09191.1 unnamed protein product [Fusarium langsethiae]
MASLEDQPATPAVPERQMKHQETPGSGSGAPITPSTDGNTAREHPERLQGSNMSETVAEGPEGMHTEIHQLESDWSEFMFGSPQDLSTEPTNSNSHSHGTAFDTTTSISEIFNSPATFLTSPPLESMLNDDLYQYGSFPFSQSAPESNKAVATEAGSVRGDRILSCQCSATPFETWEALTINISYKDSTSERSILSQKAAISSTEDILDCYRCSSKSQNIILLIDICAKLLESLKAQDKELQEHHQHTERRSAVYEMTDYGGEDEETHLRRNLWMSRMRRLGRLIAKVGELLDGDQWSAQRRLLQDVQLRFTGVMFGWQH